MKILYAANKRKSACWQLNRFIAATDHTVKTAAYSNQRYNCDIDWTLDAISDVFTGSSSFGIAYDIYKEQVKSFAPDLVISDCEIITSSIANELGIKLWQVSPLLLHYGLTTTGHRGVLLSAKYPGLFKLNAYTNPIDKLVKMSDRSFVYSHLCDLKIPLLKSKLEWVRPYHNVGDKSPIYEHNILAATINSNKALIDKLKCVGDAVYYSECKEDYVFPTKSFQNDIEYYGNIANGNVVIVDAYEDLLADAFYNHRTPYMIPDFIEQDSIGCMIYNETLLLGNPLYNFDFQTLPKLPQLMEWNYDANVKFLHEEL
jgi:hypothetical protein